MNLLVQDTFSIYIDMYIYIYIYRYVYIYIYRYVYVYVFMFDILTDLHDSGGYHVKKRLWFQ